MRGSDHVTNTATQIQIIEALGATPPDFAHHSLLTGAQGEGLSKRLGTLSLRDLRAQGVEPMALLSLMARLGSSQPVELFHSLDEIAENFSLDQFGAAPTKFDPDDLFPLTQKYVQSLPLSAVKERLAAIGVPEEMAAPFWNAVKDNITVLADLDGWWKLVSEGAEPVVAPEDEEFVATALSLLPPAPHDETTWGTWTGAVKAATGRKGRGLFMPLRKALTGMDHGPEMATLLPVLQKIPTNL